MRNFEIRDETAIWLLEKRTPPSLLSDDGFADAIGRSRLKEKLDKETCLDHAWRIYDALAAMLQTRCHA